ncbi:high affinity immunoglobulin gamma Fc receptor I-like [Eucyclogobius newberryi]|uniref:high affinity immunoglobulin gamma Fc receptor I-like n=1 Tax=Eucyclogobius newberryi TaxID=166745 RepID=UPI003B5A94AC
MDRMFSLFVLATLMLVHLNPLTYASQPALEIVTGHSKVFTGQTVRLKCVAPATQYKSIWTYTWHCGHKRLPYAGEELVLLNIKTKDNGNYSCKGIRHTSVQDIPTSESVAVDISVHGGWAILDAPSKGVVGFPIEMTCHVRGNHPIHQVILYRNGVEVLEQNDPKFVLNNLTLEDGGEHTCRASWNQNGRTMSVISAQVSVQVVEPLTQPTLSIVKDALLNSLSKLKLKCALEYNVPDPAPRVLYSFYINGSRYGTPTFDNFYVIPRSNGPFKCNAKVSQLGLSQWSESEMYQN